MKGDQTTRSEKLKAHFLVLRSQVGDDHAFTSLYNMFSGRSLRLLNGLLRSDKAQDLNQEVWLTVYKRIASLDDASRFRTWLFQITRNRALDHFRSTKRLNEFYDIIGSETEEVSYEPTVELEVQSTRLVEEKLEELSPKLREALVLNYFEGMDYEEMALILGVSLGTVKSRIHKAKQKIKTLINH